MSVETAAVLAYISGMAWVQPAFSKRQVDKAGKALVNPAAPLIERAEARQIISNWRAAHSFPLNTFQMNLRNRAQKVEPGAIIARRLKRLPSIEDKLRKMDSFGLSRIQDIGGCRAIVANVERVRKVTDLHLNSRSKHVWQRTYDYIDSPRQTGYRGVHLVYRYYSDETPAWNSLLIEIQIRSAMQHAWATAVETVGTFVGDPLKAGLGDAEWLRFFALMSSYLALREGTATCPYTPATHAELCEEIRTYASVLDVVHKLVDYSATLNVFESPSVATGESVVFILERDLVAGTLRVFPYPQRRMTEAQDRFLSMEQEASTRRELDVALVSVSELKNLRRAYPNYFADTKKFLTYLHDALERKPLAVKKRTRLTR